MGDTDPLRNLGFAAWKNNQAWMEAMKGRRWKEAVAAENLAYEKALKEPDVAVRIQPFLESLKTAEQESPQSTFTNGQIVIQPKRMLQVFWRYKGEPASAARPVADCAVEGSKVWTVRDVGEGGETYNLEAFLTRTEKPAWTIQRVAPSVVIHKSRCFYLEADRLWYHSLVSVDAKTGKSKKIHYKEKDPSWNLTLIGGQEDTLFLVANNAGQQKLWQMATGRFERVHSEGESFVPISRKLVFVRNPGQRYYVARGSDVFVPSGEQPVYALETQRILITRNEGRLSLWKIPEKGRPTLLKSFYGTLTLDTWFFSRPVLHPLPAHQTHATHTFSKDGARVPIIYVLPKNTSPRCLLVVCYGAYGLPTPLTVERWAPLLAMGWCVAFALVRGGGDSTDDWAEAARRDQKEKSVEDLEAAINTLKKQFRFSAEQVALYGRSAGGYLVGATVARHPRGDLFRMVFTEVPYVDVLRTTTNPKLPLTPLEYQEFGQPAQKLQNFGAILRLSPVNALPAAGAPELFVLCRSASNDLEVLAYESMKWIRRLRDGGLPKLLALPPREGHFPVGNGALQHRAEDLALLDAWRQRLAFQVSR